MQYFRLWRIVLSILALVYTFSPYDFLPDMLVGWGWLDDIAILYLLWHFFYRGRKTPVNAGGGHVNEDSRSDSNKPGDSRQAVPKTPYDILEVPRGASQDEIKTAYKKLAGKYHPDKVVHLGEEFKALAEKRFREIQAAYESLKKPRSV